LNGSIECWGGDGQFSPVSPPSHLYRAIYGGSTHEYHPNGRPTAFCAVRADIKATECWALDITTTNSPTDVPFESAFTNIVINGWWACGTDERDGRFRW